MGIKRSFYMPLKDGKNKLVIIDNLSLVVEKLLSRVADESEAGRAELIKIIEIAKNRYNKPIESWITGWFYQFSRTRGAEIDLAIQSIEQFPDAYTRLQEFKILVDSGKWHDGSFNYYFFDELIHSIPGYEPLTDEVRHAVIVRVSELIKENIVYFMASYKANRKVIESKELELQKTQQSNQKIVDNVLISSNLETAKLSAVSSPDKIQFSLTKQKDLWKLHWVDVLGKAYIIEPGEELIKLLVSQKSEDFDSLKPVSKRHLKRECVKARDLFLDRLQVLVNPKDYKTQQPMDNKSLASQANLNTFVLRGQAGNYSLVWINALGNEKTILLDRYPKLSGWLNEQTSLTEDHIYTLKAYLMYVNTAKTIGREDFKAQLKNCLEKRPPPPQIEPEVPVVQPKKLNMALFADIAKILGNSPQRIAPVDTTELIKTDEPILDKKADQYEQLPVDIDSSRSLIAPGRLNLDLFSVVTKSLVHKSKVPPTEENTEHPIETLSC